MGTIIRFMPPILAALFAWVFKTELLPVPANPAQKWTMWKPVGLLIPALWLMSVGPEGLVSRGGYLMRLLSIEPSPQRVALFGLVWLAFFFLGAWCLSSGKARSAFAQRFACAAAYAGLMGALGTYAFLAVARP